MSRAGVLVLPSIEEGLALVQAQAMACGCPVIATPHAGAVDLFADGREGFIVPVRDPEAIADRLARLHGDPELRAAMGEAALARVRTIGGWDDYGRAALALFLRLARARGHEVVADPG
jgi:glycosyltransferase involved in cell wall biosynthesis